MKLLFSEPKKILGRGGQAFVLEGQLLFDNGTNVPVAIKKIMIEDVDSICEQEVEALGKLNHFNVVKLLHAARDEAFV